MSDKSEKEPDGYIDIPHLNTKIPYWYQPGPTLMDVNPIYISKEDREKLLKSRADMCKNYAHAKTKTEYFHDEKASKELGCHIDGVRPVRNDEGVDK